MAAPARAPVGTPKIPTEFIRGIGPLAAISLVVGSMVGSGIFIVSADIGRQVSDWGPGALLLVWLSFLLVFLGVGAWLATSAAIAVGVYLLSGNLFYGIGSVALANVVGVVAVLRAMRACWRDLALPRTRRAISRFGEARA